MVAGIRINTVLELNVVWILIIELTHRLFWKLEKVQVL
jgi:hypothetical protein